MVNVEISAEFMFYIIVRPGAEYFADDCSFFLLRRPRSMKVTVAIYWVKFIPRVGGEK
jgi:hypothetical protein